MTDDPDIIVAELAITGIVIVLLWRYFIYLRDLPRTPDPWDAEVEKQLQEPDAMEVCHRCFTPCKPDGWFCEHCGSAVGPYNNLMPFLNVFSEGEVFRNGVNDKLPRSPLIVIGYLLLSVSAYAFFAPIYWFFLFRNLKRQTELAEETEITSPDSRL